jgi:hypothetical protein
MHTCGTHVMYVCMYVVPLVHMWPHIHDTYMCVWYTHMHTYMKLHMTYINISYCTLHTYMYVHTCLVVYTDVPNYQRYKVPL